MGNDKLNIEKIIHHWVETSDNDFKTMIHLYDSKDFHWSLFVGHIVIERLLKSGVVKQTNSHAPFTHDLRRLAKLTNFDLKTNISIGSIRLQLLILVQDMIVTNKHFILSVQVNLL